jgi:hypothetical protein
LIGLAEVWPEGCQYEILKSVLSDWNGFVISTRHLMDVLADMHDVELANVVAPDGKPAVRKVNYPSLTYLRRFHMVAVAGYAMKLQGAGKPVPPAVLAIYQSLPL